MTRDQASAAVPLPEASRAFGVSVSTLRRWIDSGAPVVSPGGRGRGRHTMIDLAAVRAWRAGRSALQDDDQADSRAALALVKILRKKLPGAIAKALVKVDGSTIDGQPAWRALGIFRHGSAAGLELLAWEEICATLDLLLEHEAHVIGLQRSGLADMLELTAASQLPAAVPVEIAHLRSILRDSL